MANSAPHIVAYIDFINSWWPPTAIAGGIGVPGYARNTSYNVINLAFWTTGGPADIALLWGDAIKYVSTDNPWGSTTAAVQKAWLDRYHAAGIKVLVSAFGATDFPTTGGVDPVQCGQRIADFVKQNQLDGVDLDYEDNGAMNAGKGEAWLIAITKKLRQELPKSQGYIISHAPQAPYFMGPPNYPAGGYLAVDKAVGGLIDFYNVQFYNQGSSAYTNYETLFQQSDGWSTNTAIMQMQKAGIPLSRIVIGKPVSSADASNTGYIPIDQLTAILAQGTRSTPWRTGVMGWQYVHDTEQLGWSNKIATVLNSKM